MLGVCLGVGAKGKLELVVDAGTIAEFCMRVFYQLARAGYDVIQKLISDDVLEMVAYLEQLTIIDGKKLEDMYRQFLRYSNMSIQTFIEQARKYTTRKKCVNK